MAARVRPANSRFHCTARTAAVAMGSALVLWLPASSHPGGSPAAAPHAVGTVTDRVEVTSSARLVLRSIHNGRDYEVRVGLPRSYGDTARRFPVVYVLDGNALFGLATDISRLLSLNPAFPETIVVGIAYPGAGRGDVLRRRLADFTPTNVPQEDTLHGAHTRPLDERSGNAAAFTQVLLHEVIPLVERRFRADSTQRMLWGYSLGGLFAFGLLLEYPGVFRSYLLSSPSLWWDRRWVLRREAEPAHRRGDLPGRLFLSVGALEQQAEHWAEMGTNLDRLQQTLSDRGYRDLEVSTAVLADETHLSMPAAAFARGIRVLLAR
jgi:predicted alpha/beta superfamily hydrolase